MTTKMKVVAYTRVSTDEQFTVSQLTEIENYCKMKGYEIVKVFPDEISGKVDPEERPRFREMLEFCEKTGIKTVVMYDLTRFYRADNPLDALIKMRKFMDDYGILIEFVAEPQFEDPLFAELWRFIKSFIATYERRMISLRTKYGLARVRREGRLFHRPTILHYFAYLYTNKPLPRTEEERKGMFRKLSLEDLKFASRAFLIIVEKYWNDKKYPKTLISQVLKENDPIFRRLYEVFPQAPKSYYAYKKAIELARSLTLGESKP